MATDSSPLVTYLLANEPTFRGGRIAALYSDFSPLISLNPDGYTANINTWTHGLSSAARSGVLPSSDTLVISLDETLFQELDTAQHGRPLALGIVLSEAIKRKQWMTLRDFTDAKDSIYKSRWAIPSLGEVLGWGLKQLGLGFGAAQTTTGRLVILSNVEEAGKVFEGRTKEVRGRAQRLWSLRSFKEDFRDLLGTGKGLSDADFDVLLRFLQRDRGLVSWDGETVKVRGAGEMEGITSEDATVANLKTLIADLTIQVKVMERRVHELNVTARQAVERKNRVSALSALRSKKLAEGTLEKRSKALAQLEDVFASIEQAADQVELVHIMEGSTRVLAGLNKEVGGVARVDDVVDQLREQMGQVDEIGDVIAEAGQSGVDEGEVDDELEVLEGEERAKREEIERKEREERERIEAEETKKRLDALGEAERLAREKKASEAEKGVDESVESLQRMSLDPSENIPA